MTDIAIEDLILYIICFQYYFEIRREGLHITKTTLLIQELLLLRILIYTLKHVIVNVQKLCVEWEVSRLLPDFLKYYKFKIMDKTNKIFENDYIKVIQYFWYWYNSLIYLSEYILFLQHF